MNVDELTIGEAKQLANLFGGGSTGDGLRVSGKQIVVLHRGHIVVGDVSNDGETVVVENAAVVRRWGTTEGLGELAEKGPLADTILDACRTVRVHQFAVIMAMECSDAWK